MIDPGELGRFPLFADVSATARRALAARAVRRTYEAGETIFTAGARPAGCT